MKTAQIPKDGLAGLKENFSSDFLSGFLVFLLALPLSLGIAKASGFPAAMGVLTAMIGGLIVGIFQGGRLTIKGPAAGLITVCAGAVVEFSAYIKEINPAISETEATTSAVALTCGVVVVMSAIQMLFGFLKFGSLSDFFPHSAVHGMLAAIGVLIFAKQFPILLGTPADLTKGLSPIQLYLHIPQFIANSNPSIAIIGIASLILLFGLPAIGGIFKKIPAPMVVLVVMIPLGIALNLKVESPASLVKIGDFWGGIAFNASFSAIGTGLFWKYVVMFLFVNSLESLLTVKAIDGLDPFKRKSDYNKDLKAVALGNGVAGLLGGIPMISEVARSSANVNNGARTRWANVFHGLCLLVAMLLLIPVIEMIPNAALAAMLIAVAYRLASPKEFKSTYKIGAEQLIIFLVTIIVTVAEDLLLGVAAGILVKFIFHIINGAPVGSLFKATYDVQESGENITVNVKQSAVFSNLLGFQKMWGALKPGKKITFNFSEAKLVDHTFQEALHHFEEDYHGTGGDVSITGLEKHKGLSPHPMAARKLVGAGEASSTSVLSQRATELKSFASSNGFAFDSKKINNPLKYKGFPIQGGSSIRFEENILQRNANGFAIEVADVTLTEIQLASKEDTNITMLHVAGFEASIPDFALEPESMHTKLSELVGGKDLDFKDHPEFSKRYYLRGYDENSVRNFFNVNLINFFEGHEELHVEAHDNNLLIFKKRGLMSPSEIQSALKFTDELIKVISKK
jgi:MFS superfamily sulfate permease-like transporter